MIRRHTISFKHAINGFLWALKTQPNYIIHLSLSILSLLFGVLLEISTTEFIIIIVLIFIGLTIETINTSIEKTCDAISKTYDPDIHIAKDVSAGAMFIFATGASIVALMIFLPKLLQLIFRIS